MASSLSRDEIIRMARQICDASEDANGRLEYEMDSYGLVAFANLVAAAEREACAELCEAKAAEMFEIEGTESPWGNALIQMSVDIWSRGIPRREHEQRS